MLLPGAALAAQTDLPKIGELIEEIIQPLAQTRGIEAFQANIVDASSRIRGGTLRSIREVEVMLVSSGRVSEKSPHGPQSLYLTVSAELPVSRSL